MNRLLIRYSAFAVLGFAVVCMVGSGSYAADPAPIDEIMQKVNKGPDALMSTLKKDLAKKDDVKWETVQMKTKEVAMLTDDLCKDKPPKGSQESWDKLTKAYSDNAKSLSGAAEKKDFDAATKSLKAMGGSCMSCHSAHRPKK